MRRQLLGLGFVVLAIAVLSCTGAAQARPDRSFGENGVVRVQPPLPVPYGGQLISQLAAGAGGETFVLATRYCFAERCADSEVLVRYRADGSPDPTFGGPAGAYQVPPDSDGPVTLAVDPLDRPLLVRLDDGRIFVRRLTPSGAPDPGFGDQGLVTLDCNCRAGDQVKLVPGPDGAITLVLPVGHSRERNGQLIRTGTDFTLVRLESDGSRDRRFGGDGESVISLSGVESPAATAISETGALYLGGTGCCTATLPGFVVRISARGRLDRRFAQKSRHSLESLQRLNTLDQSVNGVIIRPEGKVDLLGSGGYLKGFLLRLKSNGELERTFGSRGLRTYGLSLSSAAAGSGGTTLAVSDEGFGNGRLIRILAGGRLDRGFGKRGIQRLQTDGDVGLSVVSQRGHRVLVLDPGTRSCRTYCVDYPELFRFLER